MDTRVPLLFRLPGITGGKRISAIVECLDLYPTLAELTGLPLPVSVDGNSFAGLVHGDTDKHQGFAIGQFIRSPGLGHSNYDDCTVVGDALRTDRYRLVRWREKKAPQSMVALDLYDHRTDPKETVNVAGQSGYSDTVGALLEQLDGIIQPEAL